MDLFEEISKTKKDFPMRSAISNEFHRQTFNFYQGFAIVLFVILFVLGIFLGNLFATCQASSYFYSDECLVTEFNFSVMILVWFGGFLLSTFIYAIGHIIELLKSIDEKLVKFQR
ncbi:MAG: hypothetical protein IKF71_05410 [Bacilli bacterium]|nr:hypothetical protein [Bacilli bacterium]